MDTNEKLEVDLLLQAIYQKYGYDFRNYAKASIRRRIKKHLDQSGLIHISDMLHKLIHDEKFFAELLMQLTINVTEMFRDPDQFHFFRTQIVPTLAQKDHVQFWHAGCSTGEEVYSMAVLLEEEGLKDRYRLYATDTSTKSLAIAKKGIYPTAKMKEYTANYQKAGGTSSFSDYYTAHYDNIVMTDKLRNNIVFSDHNLVTDSVFSEMDCIVCRNVLIYFSRTLQDRVFQLFYDALPVGGYLFLGNKEHIRFSAIADKFEILSVKDKFFRKVR